MISAPLRRLLPAAPAVLAALALLVGCRVDPRESRLAGAEGELPHAGGTAVAGSIADLRSINDLLTGSTQFNDDLVQRFLFLRLLEEQPDFERHPPTFAPRLAESYEWSPDHRILTLHLRPGVLWSDGAPVTAEDVRWTWQAQTSPAIGWEGAASKKEIRDVEAADPRTVRFHFQRAYFSQLTDANEGVILPRHAWEKIPFAQWRESGDWFRQNLVTDGPFLLDSWKAQQEIVLRRNPRYFEAGLPRLDRFVIRIIPDRGNLLAQLLAGALDYVDQIPPAEAERVRASPNLRLLTFPGRQYTFVCWNTRSPLFDDPEVRRALTLGIDRQGILDALWHGFARLSNSPLLSSVWAHNNALQPWPYDPAAAARILAERGWSDSDGDGLLDRGGKKFSFEIATNSGNAVRADAAVMIQAQLQKVGIEARPRILELNSLLERAEKHDFDALILAWTIDTSLDLSYAFHSRSIDNGDNYGGYANAEVDRLIDAARSAQEPVDAKPHFDRIQEILHREQPYTFLWEPVRMDAAGARLRDTRPNSLSSYFNVREWWLGRER